MSRIVVVPDDPLSTSILADTITLDAKILTLLQREVSTLRYRDQDDASYVIASASLTSGIFQLHLQHTPDEQRVMGESRKFSRDMRPASLQQVLSYILHRLVIVDGSTGIEYEPSVIDCMVGGYDFYIEDTEG